MNTLSKKAKQFKQSLSDNCDKPEYFYGTFDTSIIYEFHNQPDLINGRCDNCGNAHFESSVGNFQFLRKCRNCGMTKNI